MVVKKEHEWADLMVELSGFVMALKMAV